MKAAKPVSYTHINDSQLLEQTQILVESERETTLSILHNFAEIEARRLFAKRGYPSLFAMAVELFKYSPGAAERRISASRLLRQIPEVQQKISDGTLNLTVVAKANTFFEAERRAHHKPYTTEQKREVVARLENLSTREAERELLRISPEQLPRESSRPLSETHTEIRLVVSQELLEKLNQLRDQLSHANPGMTYGGVVEILISKAHGKSQSQKLALLSTHAQASRNRTEQLKQARLQTGLQTQMPTVKEPAVDVLESAPATSRSSVPAPVNVSSKRIPLSVRRQVVKRDGGVCTFTDPLTNKRCNSQSFLEMDHVLPRTMGGGDGLENLRLVCRAHNQLFAIRNFGAKKMKQYIQLRHPQALRS